MIITLGFGGKIMKKNFISILTILVALCSTIASLVGLFQQYDSNISEFISVNGQVVELHQMGLYYRDSISVASQGIASDFVTLIIGVPSLILSLVLFVKNKTVGHMMLTGIVGYFLYTYTSYTFLWNYNNWFLLYVLLMGLSFYLFILLFSEYNLENIKDKFSLSLPIKFIGFYQIFIGIVMGLMWLGIIVGSLINGNTPVILEHYTTLVIQAMDLGVVVPLFIISGVLLLKRKPWGYVLSSVVIVKGTMMLLAIVTMMVNQIHQGVDVGFAQIIIFSFFTVVSFLALYLLIKNCKGERICLVNIDTK